MNVADEPPTYPPEQHVLRDLRIESVLVAPEHATAELPVDVAVRGADGAVALGALATLVDTCGSRVSTATAHPHWTATADLSVTTARRPHDGVVGADARLLKAGSKVISVGVDLGGVGSTFARIPREASAVIGSRLVVGQRLLQPLIGPPPDAFILGRMGLRVVDGGIDLELGDYVRNSFGTIHGGALAFLVTAAAEGATGMVGADLLLRYLGQTAVGARAEATVVRSGPDHAVCDVRVVESGGGARLLAQATVTTVRGDADLV
jgi:acyl-coenzyme A thioesterase PaaI-like protein